MKFDFVSFLISSAIVLGLVVLLFMFVLDAVFPVK